MVAIAPFPTRKAFSPRRSLANRSSSCVTSRASYALSATFAAIAPDRLRSAAVARTRSEEHTSELQSRLHLVCRLLLEKKKQSKTIHRHEVRARTQLTRQTI